MCQEFRTFVEETEKELLALFRGIDYNGDGKLSKEELRNALRRAGLAVPNTKLDSFFALTERGDYIVTPAIVPAARIVALADHARDEPLDPVMRVTLISRGRADVERLAALLVDAAR